MEEKKVRKPEEPDYDPHDHDFTGEYRIISEVVKGVKNGSIDLRLEMCSGCGNLNKCGIPYADALRHAFCESQMPCVAVCSDIGGKRILKLSYENEVFMQIDPLTREAIQRCHDEMCNTVLYNRVFDVEL
jgi:hypothetical protein